MRLDGGCPQTERKGRKLRTESSCAAVGCAERMTPCPMPVQGAAEEMKSVEPMNGSPRRGHPKPKSQDAAKDVRMTTQEERLQALRTKLRNEPLFQDAEKACRTLAEEGCDMPVLMGQVGRVAGYKSGNGRRAFRIPTGQQMSREIRAISR